ncbi:NUDIX hydrolase [Paracoccus aminophilus]|nr:NUDIX domain-containing protein [Paracoccus aminophilus]
MSSLIRRDAVRAILLTPEDEVLLMRVRWDKRRFWITPGGGIEPGESREAALCRELAEELGLSGVVPGPQLWRREHELGHAGRRWRQCEDYFLIETPRFTPVLRDLREAQTVEAFRWWPLPELARSIEPVTPVALAAIVKDYRRHGAPDPLPPTEVVIG